MMVEVGVLAHAAADSAGRRLARDHVPHCHLQSTVSAIIANGNGLAGGSKAAGLRVDQAANQAAGRIALPRGKPPGASMNII